MNTETRQIEATEADRAAVKYRALRAVDRVRTANGTARCFGWDRVEYVADDATDDGKGNITGCYVRFATGNWTDDWTSPKAVAAAPEGFFTPAECCLAVLDALGCVGGTPADALEEFALAIAYAREGVTIEDWIRRQRTGSRIRMSRRNRRAIWYAVAQYGVAPWNNDAYATGQAHAAWEGPVACQR